MDTTRHGDETRRPPHFHLSSRVPSAEWSTRIQEKNGAAKPRGPKGLSIIRMTTKYKNGVLRMGSRRETTMTMKAGPRLRVHPCVAMQRFGWRSNSKKCHPLFLSAEADDRLRGGQVKPDLASRPLTPENIGRLWPPRTIPKGSSPKVRIQNWSSLTPMPRASCNNTSPNGLPPPNGRFIRTGIVFLDHLGATFTPSRPRNG